MIVHPFSYQSNKQQLMVKIINDELRVRAREATLENSSETHQLKMLNYPFSSLCRIATTMMEGNKKFRTNGTGILLAPLIMLTALHNITEKNGPKPVDSRQIKVFMGQNGAARPENTYRVKEVRYDPLYFSLDKSKPNKYDYALLLLEPEERWPIQQQFSAYLPLGDIANDWEGNFEIYGYDSIANNAIHKINNTKDDYYLFGTQDWLQMATPDFLLHKIATQTGCSGAPLLSYCGLGVFKIIALHLGAADFSGKTMNYGLRITGRIKQQITKWMLVDFKQAYSQNEIDRMMNPHQSILKLKRNPTNQIYGKDNVAKHEFLEHVINIMDQIMFVKKNQAATVEVADNKPEYFFQAEKVQPKRVSQPQYVYKVTQRNSLPPKFKEASEPVLQKSPSVKKQLEIVDKDSLFEYLNSKDLKTSFLEERVLKLIKVPFQINNPSIVASLANLSRLSLQGCRIKEIKFSLREMPELRKVWLRYNQISNLSPLLQHHITLIDLGWNCVWRIPADIDRATSLEQLHLNKNQLNDVDSNIRKLDKLRVLNLAQNQDLQDFDTKQMLQNLNIQRYTPPDEDNDAQY